MHWSYVYQIGTCLQAQYKDRTLKEFAINVYLKMMLIMYVVEGPHKREESYNESKLVYVDPQVESLL